VTAATAAVAAVAALSFADSGCTVRRDGEGELDSGGIRRDGSRGIGIGSLKIGSTKVPVVPTGARASFEKLRRSTFVRAPMFIVSADWGADVRISGPK
jgi:hypothetical protein